MSRTTTIAAALVAGALIAPAAAQAHARPDVASVEAHTVRADAALDRAMALYERNAGRSTDRRADRDLARSRREMAAARREAAQLRADSARQRAAAARALALVAVEQDQNVEKLTAALADAPARSERRLAAAARFDVLARERSLAALMAMLDRLPAELRERVARVIAARLDDRHREVSRQGRALTDREVTQRSKRTVARSVGDNVDALTEAAERLAALIASDDVPEQAKPALRRAHEKIIAAQGRLATILARLSDRMPTDIRALVQRIIEEARQRGRAMREEQRQTTHTHSESAHGEPGESAAAQGQPGSSATGQQGGDASAQGDDGASVGTQP